MQVGARKGNGFQCHFHLCESLGDNAVSLIEESEEDVLGPNKTVLEEAGFFLGQRQDPAGAVGEALEHAP